MLNYVMGKRSTYSGVTMLPAVISASFTILNNGLSGASGSMSSSTWVA